MPDNTSSGESLPNGSHPPAQPEPAAKFQSYAEYLARLDRSPSQSTYLVVDEQLWLASFTEDGRYIKRYTCILQDIRNSKYLPAVDVEDISHEATVLSSADFQTLLQTTDENVHYRIVIAVSNLIVPSRMVEDILGLGLDLKPEIFDYVKGTVENTSHIPPNEFPLPWFKDAPALRIGSDVLCILESTPERKSKTAIIFLRGDDGGKVSARNSLGSTMFSSKRPSQMCEGPDQGSNRHATYYRRPLVERYITEAIESKTQFGPGNFLYVCLAALLELHLSAAPTNVFQFEHFCGRRKLMRPYRGADLETANEPLSGGTYPDMAWSKLRNELDHQRHTLRWMTRFFKRHLDYRNKDLQAAFKEIRERFRLRVQDLEHVESQLRDHLASEGIHRSIRMAEMSIRESKRVMLLTALAFIFLPISLASSVYGMNVQQINGTGHSIGAFVITAFAMFASAVALWVFIAGVQSRRAQLKRDLESDSTTYRKWKWFDQLIMFVSSDRWKVAWYKLRLSWVDRRVRHLRRPHSRGRR